MEVTIVPIKVKFRELAPGIHEFTARLVKGDTILPESIEADNEYNVTFDVMRMQKSGHKPDMKEEVSFLSVQRGRTVQIGTNGHVTYVGQARMIALGTRISYVFKRTTMYRWTEVKEDGSESN